MGHFFTIAERALAQAGQLRTELAAARAEAEAWRFESQAERRQKIAAWTATEKANQRYYDLEAEYRRRTASESASEKLAAELGRQLEKEKSRTQGLEAETAVMAAALFGDGRKPFDDDGILADVKRGILASMIVHDERTRAALEATLDRFLRPAMAAAERRQRLKGERLAKEVRATAVKEAEGRASHQAAALLSALTTEVEHGPGKLRGGRSIAESIQALAETPEKCAFSKSLWVAWAESVWPRLREAIEQARGNRDVQSAEAALHVPVSVEPQSESASAVGEPDVSEVPSGRIIDTAPTKATPEQGNLMAAIRDALGQRFVYGTGDGRYVTLSRECLDYYSELTHRAVQPLFAELEHKRNEARADAKLRDQSPAMVAARCLGEATAGLEMLLTSLAMDVRKKAGLPPFDDGPRLNPNPSPTAGAHAAAQSADQPADESAS